MGYRELKGRGNRDTFWYEWKRRQKGRERETEIERGGQTLSEVYLGDKRGAMRRTEGIVKDEVVWRKRRSNAGRE